MSSKQKRNIDKERQKPELGAGLESYMNEQIEGIRFLRRRFRELWKSPDEKILSEVGGFGDILRKNQNTRSHEAIEDLEQLFGRNLAIKPEDVPDSYFELLKKIARERGEGELEITDEFKRKKIGIIIADQKATLKRWIDELSSRDADAYPDWIKYWALRGMLGLTSYDKKNERFSERTKGSAAPFPELNKGALAEVMDIMRKKLRKEPIHLKGGYDQ